jgi:hypothetical protein
MTTTTILTARRPRSGQTTMHRDGTVTLWDVWRQQWRRLPALAALHLLGASLSARERATIARRVAS